jgi:hypothetical protein
MMYSFAYDPELDLWAIINPEGYTFDWEVFKRTAVIRMRKLNNE